MTNKNARTVTQPSNRANAKDTREKKTVFKAVFDNPHRIHWPSVPLNLQNAILAKILQLLDGTSEYQLQRFAASRKRKRKEKFLEPKGQTLELDEFRSSTLNHMDEDVPSVPSEDAQVDVVPECPALFQHLVYGINQVTRRLENQVQAVRRPVIATLPEQPAKDSSSALQSIFVCRSDMNPSLAVDHLPHLVAAYNSCRPPFFVTLVPLPTGAELSLAEALGIRRVAVFGIDTLYSRDASLKSLLDKVPTLTASWLSQADTSRTLIPTHLKQLRTTAPKDMKAAKESRNKERAQAKQRKRLKSKARGEKFLVTKHGANMARRDALTGLTCDT